MNCSEVIERSPMDGGGDAVPVSGVSASPKYLLLAKLYHVVITTIITGTQQVYDYRMT
jgi:hypothetical protein